MAGRKGILATNLAEDKYVNDSVLSSRHGC